MPNSLRRLFTVALVTVALLAPTAADASMTPAQQHMYGIIQRTRAAHNINGVRWAPRVARVAQRHSERMATLRRLFHSRTVGSKLSSVGCKTWGEILGASSSSLKRIRNMWLKSVVHRAILLSPTYHRVGIGVARTRNAWWVTADFCA